MYLVRCFRCFDSPAPYKGSGFSGGYRNVPGYELGHSEMHLALYGVIGVSLGGYKLGQRFSFYHVVYDFWVGPDSSSNDSACLVIRNIFSKLKLGSRIGFGSNLF